MRFEAFVNFFLISCAFTAIILRLPDIQSMGIRRNRIQKDNKDKIIYTKYLRMLGLNVNPKVYRQMQMIISFLVIAYLALIALTTKDKPIIEGIFSIIIIALITPETGVKIIGFIKSKVNNNEEKIQSEIHQALLVIKTLSKNNYKRNSLDILMKISSGCNAIQPQIHKVIQGWNNSDKEELVQEFINEINTTEATELGSIMMNLDDVETSEFEEQIDLYLDKIMARRHTQREKADRKKGNIFFGLVVVVFMLIMMTFIYIVMYESMQTMFKM